ncbi:MAG: hypothetical protein CME70_02625 [Halobacteriovorax sp.]|nr:hypothetical protein [Halobacteriovorax sp.]
MVLWPSRDLLQLNIELPVKNSRRLSYDKSIADVLDLTIDEAADFFSENEICSILEILKEVGLGYLTLGQPLSSLSGGECQRIKLSKELKKKGEVYIFDEPTTGLHVSDIQRIISILNKLVDNGNTVIVIEHNLDVISQADWIIDIGPHGGKKGGEIVFEGSPRDLINSVKSLTGKHLKMYLSDS